MLIGILMLATAIIGLIAGIAVGRADAKAHKFKLDDVIKAQLEGKEKGLTNALGIVGKARAYFNKVDSEVVCSIHDDLVKEIAQTQASLGIRRL